MKEIRKANPKRPKPQPKVCKFCGKEGKYKICQQCRQERKATPPNKRRILEGMCSFCGKREPLPGRKRCPECIQSQRMAKLKSRLLHPTIPQVKEKPCKVCGKMYEYLAVKGTGNITQFCSDECRKIASADAARMSVRRNAPRYYKKRKATGLCTRCYKPIDNDKWVTCNACHEKARIRIKEYYNQKVKEGKCIDCGKPRDNDKWSRCVKCHIKMTESLKNKTKKKGE